MTRRALALALALGCVSARARPTPPRAAAERPRPTEAPAGWVRVAPRDRPARVTRVAALRDGGGYLLGGDVYRWTDAGELTLVCRVEPGIEPRALHASDAHWWALGGEVFGPVAVRGDVGAAGCVRVALPPLVVRGAAPGHVRAVGVGDDAFAWSTGGAIAWSRDGALTWRRLPTLPAVIAVTVSGEALYAAALLGGPGSSAPFDARGYELYAWREGDTRWTFVGAPGDRSAPVALLPRGEGGVTGLDALGGFTVRADGVAVVTASRGPHFARDRPSELVPFGADAAVGIAEGRLVALRADGWSPLPPLPGLLPPTCLDASADGGLVVGDGADLWRVREGARPEALVRSPLGHGDPAMLAAGGSVVAVLSRASHLVARSPFGTPEQLVVSRDGGASWHHPAMPPELGAARALGVLPDGTVYLVAAEVPDRSDGVPTGGALWAGARELARIALPPGARIFEATPSLRAVGGRWILAAGDIFVSDDQGARWRRTLAAPSGPREGWDVVALAADRGRVVFALDSLGRLWRSTDAGDEFVALTPERRREPTMPRSNPDWLRWDGGDALVASIGHQVFRFDAEGRGGPLGALRWVEDALPAGELTLVAASASRARSGGCADQAGVILMTAGRDGEVVPIADACEHRAMLVASDGDAVYTLDEEGVLERASLRALLESNVR